MKAQLSIQHVQKKTKLSGADKKNKNKMIGHHYNYMIAHTI